MIVIAPTSFKGTVSATAAARAMAAGAREVTSAPIHIQPLSDGGPGLIDALSLTAGVMHQVRVRGPSNVDVAARVLVRSRTAVIESADACGLHLVPKEQRDPTTLTTWGVGELLAAASKLAVDRIIVGLGGSATVDGGVGMREALRDKPIAQSITALADVSTTLVDAARVFGPQKGATPAQVELLANRLAELLKKTGVPDFPGAGAAGGLGYGLSAFLNAEVLSGSEWVIAETGVAAAIANAHVVITGEGEFDDQSFMGKITGTLIRLAQTHRVPILVVAGRSARVGGYEHVARGSGALLGETDLQRLVREHLPALLPN
jgi:glycerate kinase